MEGLIAGILVVLAIIVAGICFAIYSAIGISGCLVLGGIIIAFVMLALSMDRYEFYHNRPVWFQDAMAAEEWDVKVTRTPLPVRQEWDDIGLVATHVCTAEVVIPTFSLITSHGENLCLTRERNGHRTYLCDGAFAGLVYKNIMTINGQPVEDENRYHNALMKHLCRVNSIDS